MRRLTDMPWSIYLVTGFDWCAQVLFQWERRSRNFSSKKLRLCLLVYLTWIFYMNMVYDIGLHEYHECDNVFPNLKCVPEPFS